jgi:hypothetical protein
MGQSSRHAPPKLRERRTPQGHCIARRAGLRLGCRNLEHYILTSVDLYTRNIAKHY